MLSFRLVDLFLLLAMTFSNCWAGNFEDAQPIYYTPTLQALPEKKLIKNAKRALLDWLIPNRAGITVLEFTYGQVD